MLLWLEILEDEILHDASTHMKPTTQNSRSEFPDISSIRFSLLVLALAYTAFVIYGSLVPLNFQHHPWQWALESFRNIQYLNLGISSRADWVANILLFIPLAIVWLGTLWHSRSLAWRALATLFVLIGCCSLSVAIEFTQLFFPPRTVSLNDIYAETLGTIIGLTAWWMTGATISRWYLGWRIANGSIDLAQRLLYTYLFLLFGYNLLPLDLTLSPFEIFHKWREGRILIIPFIDGQANLAQRFYALITDVLIWLPVGLLAQLSAGHQARQIWFRLTATAALIEFLQVFVYTRVTDTSDILTASLGSAIGIWLASLWNGQTTSAKQSNSTQGYAGLITGLAFWLALIFSVFWYPFDFDMNGSFVRGQLAEASSRVPFSLYYFGTEYRAATEVLHKIGFFLPLGVLLVLLINRIHFILPPLKKLLALTSVALIAASVEAGQLFLPHKFADLTDLVLETMGGWIGIILILKIQTTQRTRPMPTQLAPVMATPALAVPQQNPWLFVTGLVLGIALLLLAITHISAVPYNIRELISADYPIFSALLLACSVILSFGFPVWAVIRLAAGRQQPLALPKMILIHAGIAWVLLRLAVPLESIHDIVGSPILNWPWEWERIGRFMALFVLWSVTLFGAVMITLRTWVPNYSRLLWMWIIISTLLFPVSYFVVIKQAATDNLYELLDGGGTPVACMWVVAGIFVLALAGTQLARAAGSRFQVGAIQGILWGIISFPLTYLALNAGFESYIIKYDQVFSAFQFLLSQDRAHYAEPTELLLRYAIVHGVLLLTIAVCQLPFFWGAESASAYTSTSPTSEHKRRRRSKARA